MAVLISTVESVGRGSTVFHEQSDLEVVAGGCPTWTRTRFSGCLLRFSPLQLPFPTPGRVPFLFNPCVATPCGVFCCCRHVRKRPVFAHARRPSSSLTFLLGGSRRPPAVRGGCPLHVLYNCEQQTTGLRVVSRPPAASGGNNQLPWKLRIQFGLNENNICGEVDEQRT